MNPLQEYIAIIHTRQQDPLPEGQYGERHHVIPKSCGGCNKKWNIVRLTPEEHYRCHYLLTFIYPTGKEHRNMVYAWVLLQGRSPGVAHDDDYARLKSEYAELQSSKRKGKTPWNKGKTGIYSEEILKRNSEAHKGKTSPMKGRHHSEETRKRWSEIRKGMPSHNKGKKMSEEQKRKISETRKLRKIVPWNKGKSKKEIA